jgi:hypothetical protein
MALPPLDMAALTHEFAQNMIRKEFWKLLRNQSDMVGIETSPNTHDHEMLYHRVHCFEYLRQTLMCSMDMTIEYPAIDSKTGEAKGFINGWDVAHTCKKKVKSSLELREALLTIAIGRSLCFHERTFRVACMVKIV